MEIEIKAEADDFGSIRKRLSELGAEYAGKTVQKDVYFNHPSSDFYRTDEALRVRYASEGVFLTYKGPKLDMETKSREEIEVEVSDGEKVENVLEKLGFHRVGTVRKLRTLYSFNDMQIALDHVDGLGFFVELEIAGEHTEENIEKLFDTARKLGLGRFIRESYLELVLKK